MNRLLILFLGVFGFFLGCNLQTDKDKAPAGDLSFNRIATQSAAIKIEARLDAFTQAQELLLKINLENVATKDFGVMAISIETDEGYQAQPLVPGFSPFDLKAGADTSIMLRFKPINDFKLYMAAGESGKFKPMYYLFVACKGGEEAGNPVLIKELFKVKESDFAIYENRYRELAVAYRFNPQDNFEKELRSYLHSFFKTPLFVYVSEQEIAVAGLNFRLQSYIRGDSFHAKLNIVNHADFPVLVNPGRFDAGDIDTSAGNKSRQTVFKKLQGVQEETTILRKGDRATLDLIKYVGKLNGRIPVLTLKEVFILPEGKSLFNKDISLAKI